VIDSRARHNRPVLPVHLGTVRLFVHVLAATVWVGGQITLAGLLPTVRVLGPDAARALARGFNRIAWPAFAVLVATGIWNIVAAAPSNDTAYDATLALKVAVVALSGVASALHGRSRSRAALAVWGALGGLAAMGALFLGVLLAGS
jgi:putative copper export protein